MERYAALLLLMACEVEAAIPAPESLLEGLTPATWEQALPVRKDGTVWTFGYDSFGQLVDDTATAPTEPLPASELMDASAIDMAPPAISRGGSPETGSEKPPEETPTGDIAPRRFEVSSDKPHPIQSSRQAWEHPGQPRGNSVHRSQGQGLSVNGYRFERTARASGGSARTLKTRPRGASPRTGPSWDDRMS